MESKNITLDAVCSANPSLSMSPEDMTSCFIHPTRENLPIGVYSSQIVKIEPSFDENDPHAICHFDVYHNLTDANGNSDIFRFRVFQQFNGLFKWAQAMKKYGFTSVISEIEGLCESVKIAHGHTYAYISQRELVSLPSQENEPELHEEDIVRSTGGSKNRDYLLGDDDEDYDE